MQQYDSGYINNSGIAWEGMENKKSVTQYKTNIISMH